VDQIGLLTDQRERKGPLISVPAVAGATGGL